MDAETFVTGELFSEEGFDIIELYGVETKYLIKLGAVFTSSGHKIKIPWLSEAISQLPPDSHVQKYILMGPNEDWSCYGSVIHDLVLLAYDNIVVVEKRLQHPQFVFASIEVLIQDVNFIIDSHTTRGFKVTKAEILGCVTNYDSHILYEHNSVYIGELIAMRGILYVDMDHIEISADDIESLIDNGHTVNCFVSFAGAQKKLLKSSKEKEIMSENLMYKRVRYETPDGYGFFVTFSNTYADATDLAIIADIEERRWTNHTNELIIAVICSKDKLFDSYTRMCSEVLSNKRPKSLVVQHCKTIEQIFNSSS